LLLRPLPLLFLLCISSLISAPCDVFFCWRCRTRAMTKGAPPGRSGRCVLHLQRQVLLSHHRQGGGEVHVRRAQEVPRVLVKRHHARGQCAEPLRRGVREARLARHGRAVVARLGEGRPGAHRGRRGAHQGGGELVRGEQGQRGVGDQPPGLRQQPCRAGQGPGAGRCPDRRGPRFLQRDLPPRVGQTHGLRGVRALHGAGHRPRTRHPAAQDGRGRLSGGGAHGPAAGRPRHGDRCGPG